MIEKYRKKPVVIEAMKVEFGVTSVEDVLDFVGKENFKRSVNNDCLIQTLEGDMKVSDGDYIIKGIQGELYPCKPDIFEATYVKENSLGIYVSMKDTDSFKAVVEALGVLVSKASEEDAKVVANIFGKYRLVEEDE